MCSCSSSATDRETVKLKGLFCELIWTEPNSHRLINLPTSTLTATGETTQQWRCSEVFQIQRSAGAECTGLPQNHSLVYIARNTHFKIQAKHIL